MTPTAACTHLSLTCCDADARQRANHSPTWPPDAPIRLDSPHPSCACFNGPVSMSWLQTEALPAQRALRSGLLQQACIALYP